MPSKAKKKNSVDQARSNAKNRKEATVKDASAESSKRASLRSQAMQKKERKEPDPQLPTVEKALDTVTQSTLPRQHGNKKAHEQKVEKLVELLTESFVIDLVECKRQASQQEESSKAQKHAHKQPKRTSEHRKGDEAVIDVDKVAGGESDADTNSTLSDPYLQRVATPVESPQAPVKARDKGGSASKEVLPMKRRLKVQSGDTSGSRKKAKTSSTKGKWAEGSITPRAKRQVAAQPNGQQTDPASQENASSPTGSVFMDTILEEEVLLNEGNGDMEFAEETVTPAKLREKSKLVSGVTPLPWWRAVESRMILPARWPSNEELLKGYILAVIRSCVRDTWKADALRSSYERDASSSKGRAFLAISAALLLLERARHMGHCRTKWKSELIEELSARRGFQWSQIQPESSFGQFLGCDACLGHRLATKRLRLSGAKYDSRNFWPTHSTIDILGVNGEEDGVLNVAVELNENSRAGQMINNHETESEFCVDAQCLRKCLVFHELVHSTSILEDDIRNMIEDTLRDGVIQLPKVQKAAGQKKLTATERLQRQIVQILSQDQDFLQRRITHLVDILRLGDVYFSAGDAEVLDAGGKSSKKHATPTSKQYDAPLELNDDEFRERLRKLESLTENKLSGEFA